MPDLRSRILLSVSVAGSMLLGSCGGNSSGTSSNAPSPPVASVSLTTVSGTAARGFALANAKLKITDSSGRLACEGGVLTTSPAGTFTCTLVSGEVPPFFLVATDPLGEYAPLVSVLPTAPANAATATVNVTPLTTAIVGALASDGNALTLVASGTINPITLTAETANVVAQLAPVTSALNIPGTYSPFSSPISAANGGTAGSSTDTLLDLVQITADISTGAAALSTTYNSNPVDLATPTTPGSALSPPSGNALTLPPFAQYIAQQLTSCFALPVSARALATDTSIPASAGGSSVTQLATVCANAFASGSNGAAIAYLQSGYTLGQSLYGLWTSSSMTGASFTVSVINFYPAATTDAGLDEASIRIEYLEPDGSAGDILTTARFISNSSSNSYPSNWWLTGNQQPVSISIKPLLRQVTQLDSSFTAYDTSTFENGFNANINVLGPGNTNGGLPLSYVRITGPGLSTAGLVFTAPIPAETGQSYMDLSNVTGTVPSSYQCGNDAQTSSPIYNCPLIFLNKTQGVTGALATTLAPTPSGFFWGNSALGFNPALIAQGARYTIEVFYGPQSSQPTYTFHKFLLSTLTPATLGIKHPFNVLGPNSTGLLDPSDATLNGTLTSATLDWVQNVSGPPFTSVLITTTIGLTAVSPSIPAGATSVVDTPPDPIPPLTSTSQRELIFGYRTFDNSVIDSQFSYN